MMKYLISYLDTASDIQLEASEKHRITCNQELCNST